MTLARQFTIDLVTFDLAGTTVADEDMVEKAFMDAFAEHGIGAREDELLPYRGSAKRPIIEAMIARHCPDAAPELADKTMGSFERNLRRLIDEIARPMDGADATFAWLKKHGIRVGVTTGFDTPTTRRILARFGWDQGLVEAVCCSDQVPESRPAPWMIFECMKTLDIHEPRRVMAVGDTPRDLQAGTRAGCGGVVGVLSGSHDAISLGRHRHTHLIRSVADLPELMMTEFAE
ncbi:MAG: HAD-IA family hydrolase [Armatimonadetes bacterium]|nr:HAD-IA family hydrolase [Armatimonadota bacterium]